jgi:hypothetical protein
MFMTNERHTVVRRGAASVLVGLILKDKKFWEELIANFL